MKVNMKVWIKWGAIVGGGLAALGAVVLFSGIIPIKASSGHWAITEWVLHTAMRRSVATRSMTIDVPDNLDSKAMIMRGAGHFEHGCRFCHGAPGHDIPRVPAAMTPRPPDLGPVAKELDSEDLFYIVKHGVKMTAMPAWPRQSRDDEVWPVVAFLRAYPDLDADSYRDLVSAERPVTGDPDPVIARVCADCHGADGQGRIPGAFPKLAGQAEQYLVDTLDAYASGHRKSGTMEAIAADMTTEQRASVARYYANLEPMSGDGSTSSELGQSIAEEGIEERRIPSCVDCHAADIRHSAAYPILVGQDRDYIVEQLELFDKSRRGGTAEHANIMQKIADRGLTAEEMRAVADYFAKQRPDQN